MSNVLLRALKRKSSLEVTPDQLVKTEFRDFKGNPDLNLSVYEHSTTLSQDIIIQTHAEHAAAAHLDPPRGGWSVDLRPFYNGIAKNTPIAQPYFSFINSTHRELTFANPDELMKLASELLQQYSEPQNKVNKAELKNYVGDKLAKNDPEWERFFKESPKGEIWKKFASA